MISEPFLTGLLAAALVSLPAARLAAHWGHLSRPREDRLDHGAVALGGGAVLLLALVLATVSTAGPSPWHRRLLGFSLVLTGAGIWDDVRELSPALKALVTGFLSVAAAVWLPGSAASPAALLARAGSCWMLMHAMNLIDNMDGLALATGAFSLTGAALLTADPVAWAAAGCVVGLLFWNLPPARIFLGDGGSLLVGFWGWAWTLQAAQPQETWHAGAGLLLLWALPAADMVYVTLSRSLRRQPPWIGGRDHLSHLLLRRTGSKTAALGIWTAAHALLVVLGLQWVQR